MPVPHGIVSKLREEDQPVSILQDFRIVIVRESESNLGCGVADPQEGALLVGAIPAEGAIGAGGAVAPVAVVGLRASGSGKDREVGLGIKGGMRQPAFFECQSQQDSSPLRGVELECQRHFSPASGIQRSKDITHVLGAKTAGERGIRKLPVGSVYTEVVCIPYGSGGPKEDGSASGPREAYSAAPMPSFVSANEARFAKDQQGGMRGQPCSM